MQSKPQSLTYRTSVADLVGMHAAIVFGYCEEQSRSVNKNTFAISARECSKHLLMTANTVMICLRKLQDAGLVSILIEKTNKYPVQVKLVDANSGEGEK